MANKIDFTATITGLQRHFKHLKVLSQDSRTLRLIVDANNETTSIRNPFTIYITCDTGYPNVHDNIGYTATISMVVNRSEEIIYSVPYTTEIIMLIADIKQYCARLGEQITDIVSFSEIGV